MFTLRHPIIILRRSSVCCALLLVSLLLAGCGGDDGGSDGESGLVAPPTRTPAPVADQGQDAGSTGDTPADAVTYRLEPLHVGPGAAYALAWDAAAGDVLVSGSQGAWRYAARLQDAPQPLEAPWSRITQFSPDGTHVIAQDADGAYALWVVASGERLLTLAEPGTRVWRATISADNAQVAAVLAPEASQEEASPATTFGSFIGIVPDGATLHTWDVASGEMAAHDVPDDRVLDMIFDTSGRLILVGSADNVTQYEFVGPNEPPREIPANSDDLSVRVWDIGAGETVAVLDDLTDAIQSATLSPDGAYLAVPASEATSQYGTTEWRLQVWDARSATLLHTFDPDSVGNYDVRAFSPDGTLLAAVVNARDADTRTYFTFDQVWLWDVASGERHALLVSDALGSEAGSLIQTLDFSADGEQIAALSRDGMVLVWDTAPGDARDPLALRSDFMGRITNAAISLDGTTLYTASDSTVIHAWDMQSGTLRDAITGAPGIVSGLLTGPDGLLIAKLGYGQSRMQAWDTASGAPLALIDNNFRALRYAAITGDGTTVATSTGGGTVSLRSVSDGSVSDVILAPHQVTALAFSADGARMATGGMDGTIVLWDMASGETTATLNGHTGGVSHLAFSADGQTLVSASLVTLTLEDDRFGETQAVSEPDLSIRRWDAATGEVQQTHTLDVTMPTYVALSADGSRVAMSTQTEAGATLAVWDTITGQQVAAQPVSADLTVTALATGPTGDRIVTGHMNGTVTLWDVVAAN